jgi:hypothetical protein
MKVKIVLSVFVLLIIAGCGQEPDLKLSEVNAIALGLGDGWELMSSANVNGFAQKEENDNYKAAVSYYCDLITPENDTLKKIDHGIVNKEGKEELTDLTIDVQVKFDSAFKPGKYQIVFFVEDDFSKQKDTLGNSFKLQ